MTSPDNEAPDGIAGAGPVAPPEGSGSAPAGKGPPRRGRRRVHAEPGPADAPAPETARAAAKTSWFAPRPRWEKSPAGAAALVAFLWGMSLLLHEWLRTAWFEPRGLSASLLAAPFFAAAVIGALLAGRARRRGRASLGGPAVHRFGVASGLIGATALMLALYMGPRLLQLQQSARLMDARRQLEIIASALDAHVRDKGSYPGVSGVRSLAVPLERWLRGSLPLRDPWGHELEYRSLDGGAGYLLLSLGADGLSDVPLSDYLEEQRGARGGDDIVIVSGYFAGGGLGDAGQDVPSWPAPRMLAPEAAPSPRGPGTPTTPVAAPQDATPPVPGGAAPSGLAPAPPAGPARTAATATAPGPGGPSLPSTSGSPSRGPAESP